MFRNVHDDITSVRLLNNGGAVSLWTSYAYDPLDEILTVTDNAGNATTAAYDNFGRRVTLVSPDAGRTDYVFDTASNLTQKITANLKAAGQAVNYSYQYNRLASVAYPKFPANNSTYTYGGPGAAGNAAGRLTLLTAHGGTLQRAYGPLGEVIKETRTPAQDSVAGPNPVFTTLFSYDTWNRIQNLTYADGEVVSFNYDSGGNIKAIAGQKQAVAYPYLTFIGYDKFEARERVALGNGTATNYSYNPLNRRLTGLLAQTKSARTFMNMSYGYDAVGNIKTLANAAAVPTAVTKGGATSYSFGYDDLYQLTSATGAFAKPSQATQKFTLSMAYDGIHNITHKTQTAFLALSNGSTTPNVALTYDYPYAYAGGRPHAASQVGNHAFLYDLDGNQAGWNATDSYQNRRMVWDEDGRLQSVTDNVGAAHHLQIRRRHQPRGQEGRGRRDALHQPVVRGRAWAELEADLRRDHAHRDQARDLAHRRGLRAGRQEPQGGRAILLPPGPSGEHRLRHRRHRRGLPAPGVLPVRRDLGRRGLRRYPRAV